MSVLSIESYSEKQNRAARRVLDSLDRLDARTGAHYRRRRRYNRLKYRGMATIRFLDLPDAHEPETCRVWVRAVSQSGLAFIYPAPLAATRVEVGLDFDGGTKWFDGSIVRSREIAEEGFYEFGVAFQQRSEA